MRWKCFQKQPISRDRSCDQAEGSRKSLCCRVCSCRGRGSIPVPEGLAMSWRVLKKLKKMADVLIQTRINFGVKKWLKRPVNGEVTLHIFKMADDRGFDQKMAADCVYIICPQISMVISSIFMAKSRLIMYSCFINHMHLNVFRFV